MRLTGLFSFLLIFAFSQSSLAKRTLSLEKKAELKIQEIALEMSDIKTVRDWVDRGSRQVKLFRRQHFSKNLNQELPMVVAYGNRLLILPKTKKAKRHVLEARVAGNRILYFLDNKNVTRKKGESLNQWIYRLYSKKQKTNKSVFWSLFIKPAYANGRLFWDETNSLEPGQVGYWAAMMASMSADEWASRDILQNPLGNNTDEKSQNQKRALSLGSTAERMSDDQWQNLYCGFGEVASFDFIWQAPAGAWVNAQVAFDRNANPPMVRIDMIDNNTKKSIGRLAYTVKGGDPKRGQAGTVDQVFTFDPLSSTAKNKAFGNLGNLNGQAGATLGNQLQLGQELQQIEGNDGRFKHEPTTRHDLDYISDLKSLMTSADVALGACSNKKIRETYQIQGDKTPRAHQ